MNVRMVSPGEGLIGAVAARLRPAGKDLSRYWIVFPEKRPAYYLRKILAGKIGSSFIPPVISSLDDLISNIYAERLGLRDRLLDSLSAIALLFEIHREFPNPLGERRYLSADAFFSLGAKLFQDLEALCLAGTTTAQLRNLDHVTEEGRRKKLPLQAQGKLQSLSAFYEIFYRTLKERGFSTPASRAQEAAERVAPALFPEVEEFIFAGFFSLTEIEERLLQKIGQWPNSLFFFLDGKGIETALESLRMEGLWAEKEPAAKTNAPSVSFYRAADTHGQVFALNALLEGDLRSGTAMSEKRVIILPAAETLFPLYEQTLSVLDEDRYNISMGYPLSRTPLYLFFDKLLELLQSRDEDGRVYIPHYLRFVLHPYAKSMYFPSAAGPRTDLTRILFHAIEEELVRRRVKAFWELDELEQDAGIRKTVQDLSSALENPPTVQEFMDHLRDIHGRTIRLFTEIASVADFARKAIRILDDIYENSTARLHHFFHPYAEAFVRRLDALAKSLFAGVAFEDPASYFNLFRKVISAGIVPFAGTPLRGLQVLGFWESRCIPFDDVYVLDVNEDVLPSVKRADSLLPFAVRKELGLPTYADTERRIEYYFDTIVRGARNVHLFFIENKDKERSRLIERLIWEKQKAERKPSRDAYLKTVQYRVKLRAESPIPATKTAEMVDFLKNYRYSASALNMYLACPLSFYYAYVLGLKERESAEETLERKDIGTLVHDILHTYFRKFVGRPLTAAALKRMEMESLVERRFRDLYGGDQQGNAYLLKIQVKRHLGDFLLRYQAPLIEKLEAKALTILELETLKSTEAEFGGTGFKLSAKMDRIELRDGAPFILDYKTGASEQYMKIAFESLANDPREQWSQAVKNVQLPFYSLFYAGVHCLPPESVRSRFVMLGRNALGPEIEFSPFNEDNSEVRKAQMGLMKRVIGTLLNEIVDQAKPFEPGSDPAATCPECPYAYMCDRRM
jgi:ATP-dependent helicase/nuclease subunit B